MGTAGATLTSTKVQVHRIAYEIDGEVERYEGGEADHRAYVNRVDTMAGRKRAKDKNIGYRLEYVARNGIFSTKL